MNTTLRFWAAVAPSFLAVAGIALRAELLRANAVEVRLEVRPFDPMDALAGRYIATPLAIARLELESVRNECAQAQPGDSVWVALEPGEPWWRPTALLCSPASDSVALRGTVRQQTDALWTIDYELERFFIPHEAADPSAPTSGPRPQIVAVVSVDESGAGLLSDLLIEGEPYADWNARQPREDQR